MLPPAEPDVRSPAMASPDAPPSEGRFLATILTRIDQLLHAAVTATTVEYAPSTDGNPLRGLYVSDGDAARLASRGADPLAVRLAFERPLVDLERAGPRWRRLAAAFGLAPIEIDIVGLALAPELDLRYQRIFGYLHDDLTKRSLTPDLAFQLLCGSFEERLVARRLFDGAAPLRRCGLVRLTPDAAHPDGPVVAHAIDLDEGIVEYLLGSDRIDRRLENAVQWDTIALGALESVCEATARRVVRELEAPWFAGSHFLLLGSDQVVKQELARHVARDLECPLLVIDFARLARQNLPFDEAVRLAARTARLFGALTLWHGGEALGSSAETDAAATGARIPLHRAESWLAGVERLGLQGALLAMTDRDPQWPVEVADRFTPVTLPAPDAVQRGRLWTRHLTVRGSAIAQDDAELLGEVFLLDPAGIGRAVEQAVARARWRDRERPTVTRADLVDAARSQIARSLPRYATRIAAAHRWEDIVLPPDQMAQLGELCDHVRHRHTVLDEWEFGRRLPAGRGTAALFSGPSGTGKTMAAQIIGATLGLDLYRVEISAVVSKYIGDTEKALDELFHEAQGSSVILFFDEADALFGKRSEVKDAHDRYANIETSYLLQALEQYEGLTILATNYRHNMDDAFVRRLRFIINFPFPEEPERRRIWQRSWPDALPVADDIDVAFLARQFRLSGGNIRNVALAAAFAAAADGGRVTMTHVIRGIRREYQKLGKVCVESDFGRYVAALTSGAEG